MRLNKYIANATGMSRRAADAVIAKNRILVNGESPSVAQAITDSDEVTLDSRRITPAVNSITIMLNKPFGYVCSRNGQGNKTIYELLPEDLHHLKPVGRLDKNTSGLLLLTDDGYLAHKLTHPSFEKTKIYLVKLHKELPQTDWEKITKQGVQLEDGVSKFALDYSNDKDYDWKITMHEGRNRQIRRTFEALGYHVSRLHRTNFGPYQLQGIASGKFDKIKI